MRIEHFVAEKLVICMLDCATFSNFCTLDCAIFANFCTIYLAVCRKNPIFAAETYK